MTSGADKSRAEVYKHYNVQKVRHTNTVQNNISTPTIIATATAAASTHPQHFFLYFDGASSCNPGPSGAGFVVFDSSHKHTLCRYACHTGVATNNAAEYMALVYGLRTCADMHITHLTVRGDSKLVISQVQGKYKMKSATLRKYHTEACALLGKFVEVRLEHVPRDRNKEADRLAKLGCDERQETR